MVSNSNWTLKLIRGCQSYRQQGPALTGTVKIQAALLGGFYFCIIVIFLKTCSKDRFCFLLLPP
jgi:carbon monoxide dehydrogenase subunit G